MEKKSTSKFQANNLITIFERERSAIILLLVLLLLLKGNQSFNEIGVIQYIWRKFCVFLILSFISRRYAWLISKNFL